MKQRCDHSLGKSQQQRGHQVAAVFGVVGALRSDNPAHVAFAEVLWLLLVCAACP